jgi:hypothetical protein
MKSIVARLVTEYRAMKSTPIGKKVSAKSTSCVLALIACTAIFLKMPLLHIFIII